MKAIQFTIDEALLRRIDRLPEVKKQGRSAFLRLAVQDYLARKRTRETREAYCRGYRDSPPGPDEFGPWLEGQQWPDG
ncbi:MAG: ribbon-helix-helix protein, CopG family [Polyangiaceae bacterium]|nr:ribbon-helix-helix protein, CopG family [Polyangiaceae bacterium]